MKQTILKAGFACAAVAMLGTAVAQTGSSSGTQSGQPGQSGQTGQSATPGSTYSSEGSSSSSSSQRPLSSTGLSSHSQQAVRASEVIGADVKGSSGSQIGQIEDVILNPTSGRVEFAVISRSGMGAGSSTTSSTSGMGSSGQGTTTPGTSDTGMPGSQNRIGTSGSQTTGGTGSSSSSTYGSTSSSRSGQLIAVPWSLLRPDASSSSGTTMSSTAGQMSGERGFTLNVSESKLEQAPSLSRGSWSEIGRPEFRQRVYSHFGVSSSSSTGAAESPYGRSTGSSSGSMTPGSTTPGSTSPGSSGSSGSQHDQSE